jgi:hypothetical protein
MKSKNKDSILIKALKLLVHAEPEEYKVVKSMFDECFNSYIAVCGEENLIANLTKHETFMKCLTIIALDESRCKLTEEYKLLNDELERNKNDNI